MTEQFIFRREQREGYTHLSNELFDTTALSLTAIGLACLILSKPDTWLIRIDYFASICKEGEHCIRSALNELATAGYLMRKRQRGADGQVTTVTLISDYPRYMDVGTAENRIKGYGYALETHSITDPPVYRGSVEPRGRLTEGSVSGGVLVNTDLVNTDLVNTETNESSAAPQKEHPGKKALEGQVHDKLQSVWKCAVGLTQINNHMELVEVYGYSAWLAGVERCKTSALSSQSYVEKAILSAIDQDPSLAKKAPPKAPTKMYRTVDPVTGKVTEITL